MLELELLEPAHNENEFDVWVVIQGNRIEGGEEVADLSARRVSPSVIRIGHIEHYAGPGAFGPSSIREILKLLKQKYPGAQEIEGFRQSGARHGRAEEVRRRI